MDSPSYYPAFLDVRERNCVVLGGSAIAADKARGLLVAGAVVTVFATVLHSDFAALTIRHVARSYRRGDLHDAYLAVDASEDEATHQAAFSEAQGERVLLNVVDRPDLCHFIAPALVKRGPLQVAISTSGESPFLATAVRGMVERLLGDEWGPFVALMGDVRDRLRAAGLPVSVQLAAYERLLGSEARTLLGRNDQAGAEAIADNVVAEAVKKAKRSAA